MRADVLERVTGLRSALEPFERAMGCPPPSPFVMKSDTKDKAKAREEAEEERVRRWEKEREREKWIPPHLRKVVVPPPPPPPPLRSKSSLQGSVASLGEAAASASA